jgi:hypothetical protein
MVLGFVKSWWGQVFMLLVLIAILDRSTGFKTDVGALAGGTTSVIHELKV